MIFTEVESRNWLTEKFDNLKAKVKVQKSPVEISDDSNNDCNYCMWGSCIPTINGIEETKFNPKADAIYLRSAMGHIFVNKDVLINTLTDRTESQRLAIVSRYTSFYKSRKLYEDIYDITFGDLRGILLPLLTPLPRFYTHQLKLAIEGRNTVRIVEIFTILPPCAVNKIHELYRQKYKVSLDLDIEHAFKGRFPENLIEVLKLLGRGERKENPIEKKRREQIEKDVNDMALAVIRDRWDEKHTIFKEVFMQRTLPQLQQTIRMYNKRKNGNTLEADLQAASLESAQVIYHTILQLATDQPSYFADKLYQLLNTQSMDRVDRHELNYYIRGRCDVDLGDIKKAFFSKYGLHLYTAIINKITKMRSYYRTILHIIKVEE